MGQRTSVTTDLSEFVYTPVANDNTLYSVNNLNQYSAVGGLTPSYDLAGNMTSNGIDSFVFDTENRLVSASNIGMNATYTYDPPLFVIGAVVRQKMWMVL